MLQDLITCPTCGSEDIKNVHIIRTLDTIHHDYSDDAYVRWNCEACGAKGNKK